MIAKKFGEIPTPGELEDIDAPSWMPSRPV